MTLRQSCFVRPVPVIVAEQHGWFAAAGVDLTTHLTRSSGEQFDGLVNGDIDLAVTAMDNVVVWNQRGADLRIVAQVESTTLLNVYGRPGTRMLCDLDGAPFAVDAAANGFSLIARRLLEDAGVSASFVEVGGVRERFEALVVGRVAATLLGPPFDALAEREGLVALGSANAAFPALAGQGVVVRARRTEAESAVLSQFLGVLDRAVAQAESMSDEEGVELLRDSGFADAAGAAWRTRPRSTVVDRDGLALLESIRAGFGLLPAGYAGPDSLLDDSLGMQTRGEGDRT